MPKVLYAIQGTGNGHVIRARALYPELIKHFDVDLALVGPNSQVELPAKPIWKGEGLTLYYNRKGGLDYMKTIRLFSLSRIWKEIQSIPVQEYDFILNDFEFISLRSARLKGVPVLGVSHQAAVWSELSPKARGFSPIGKWVLHRYAKPKDNLGFHFQEWDQLIHAPILRPELLRASWKPIGYVLVYLPAYSAMEIAQLLSGIDEEMVIFSANHPATSSNWEWHEPNAEKFAEKLTSAKLVICSSGFELPSECVHLGIPMVTIPIKGQYEQGCNARMLELMGVVVVNDPSPEDMSRAVSDALQRPPVRRRYRDIRSEVVENILSWWSVMRK